MTVELGGFLQETGMETYIVDGVPIEVDCVEINHDGDFENWNLFIGGVEITNSCDFLSPFVIKALEKKIMDRRVERFNRP